MLFGSRRTATVRTSSFCETLELRRMDYENVCRYFPAFAKSVRKRAIKHLWRRLLASKRFTAAIKNARQRSRRGDAGSKSAEELHNSVLSLTDHIFERLVRLEKREVTKFLKKEKLRENLNLAREENIKLKQSLLVKKHEDIRQASATR